MTSALQVKGRGDSWQLVGEAPGGVVETCNDYLAYLADRHYSPATVRAYAFDLLNQPGFSGDSAAWNDIDEVQRG